MKKKEPEEGIVYYDVVTGKSYQYIKKDKKFYLITSDLSKIWEEPINESNLIEQK